MKRIWLSVRLPRPRWLNHDEHATQALSAVVPDLVSCQRSADPDGRWSFQRLNDHLGLGVGLRFHCPPEVLDTIEHRLRIETASRNWAVHVERFDHPADLAAELSWASSDFALDVLRDGTLLGGEKLPLAVLHLSRLIDLVDGNERAPFLFFYWQHWTNAMSPARRIELGIQAGQRADQVLADAEALRRTVWLEESLQRYVSRTRDIAPGHDLLFDHAHLTHNRLGISGTIEALAARVLRSAHVLQAA